MSRSFVVQMPNAEAKYLAGIGTPRPPTPETRCMDAIRNWLAGLETRWTDSVAVGQVSRELRSIMALFPEVKRPACGPFSGQGGGSPLPGHVDYLGAGIVRLDDRALSALAGLPSGDDFRVTFTDAGPVMTVSGSGYLAREEPESGLAP